MANLRQSILIRTDLQFSTGLLAAQVAHLHALPFSRNLLTTEAAEGSAAHEYFAKLKEWNEDPYVFVHKVPNREVLAYFESLCTDQDMFFYEWFDTVYVDISETQRQAFTNVKIGISIGPDDSDAIKAIIGDLPLL